MGGLDKLIETLRARIAEQKGRHQGGNKWIGTGGTSPFGAYGYNPEGIRIGQDGNRNFRAVKVWDKRAFKDLDDDREIGARNMRLALRRLRRFARTGAAEELDLDGTIRASARQGYIDVKLRPERRNAVKVLLFLDVGGSMDWHIEQAEALFSAARSEFKHLAHYYFHNCPYEAVWTENRRRHEAGTPLLDVIRTYGSDYRLIFVGDASMSPYEIAQPGGGQQRIAGGVRRDITVRVPSQRHLARPGQPRQRQRAAAVRRERMHVHADPDAGQNLAHRSEPLRSLTGRPPRRRRACQPGADSADW